MDIREALTKKYCHINFLRYCELTHKLQFREANAELEKLIEGCSLINEWWAEKENFLLTAARAYEAYILVASWLKENEYIERIFYDEGFPRIVKIKKTSS